MKFIKTEVRKYGVSDVREMALLSGTHQRTLYTMFHKNRLHFDTILKGIAFDSLMKWCVEAKQAKAAETAVRDFALNTLMRLNKDLQPAEETESEKEERELITNLINQQG